MCGRRDLHTPAAAAATWLSITSVCLMFICIAFFCSRCSEREDAIRLPVMQSLVARGVDPVLAACVANNDMAWDQCKDRALLIGPAGHAP